MIESTEKKLTLEEFFKQQFRNKVFLIFRGFSMAGILMLFFQFEGVEPFILKTFLSSLCTLILTAVIVPLFDIYFLKDPLATNTIDPAKYWVLAFFGDYQEIADGLAVTKKNAQERLEREEVLYNSKALRYKKTHGETPDDPYNNLDSYKTLYKCASHKMSIGITATVVLSILVAATYVGNFELNGLTLTLNTGFRFCLAMLAAFFITPLIQSMVFSNNEDITPSRMAFWQCFFMNKLDLHIDQLAEEIANINIKGKALSEASEALEKQLD